MNNNSSLLDKAHSQVTKTQLLQARKLIVFYRKGWEMRACACLGARSTLSGEHHGEPTLAFFVSFQFGGLNIYKKSFVWVWDCEGFGKNCNEQATKEMGKIFGILHQTIELLTIPYPFRRTGEDMGFHLRDFFLRLSLSCRMLA